MVLIFSFALLLLFGCSDYERDNIYDQKGVNYGGQGVGGGVSLSSMRSSSSVVGSSSSSSSTISYGSVTYNGQTYKTVKIGNQTWMAENLNYNASSSKCYNNESSNCTTYGRLYNWETAKTVCPSGWRLPSEVDFTALVKFADPNWTSNSSNDNISGEKLKASSGWNAGPASAIGTDDYGFSGLPGGGYISVSTGFANIGNYGNWWSSDEDSGTTNGAKLMKLGYYDTYAEIYRYNIESMYSVRGVKQD